MIILAMRYGNHSNRLFQNLHFEAFCKENDIEYINPTFYTMRKFYCEPCKTLKGYKGILPLISSFTNNFILRVIKKLQLMNITSFDSELNNNENLLIPPPQHIQMRDMFVSGWYFRVPDLLKKHQDYFIKKYALKSEYYANNEMYKKFVALKNEGIFIIGVHIRRGDYKYWGNGRYYFDDNTYLKYMQNLKSEVKNIYNKESLFIIFSNEKIVIKEAPDIILSKNKWYIDQFIMSQCDLLIGPPSTFTSWASYMGNVKRFWIENDSGEISIDKFTVAVSQ